MNREHRALVSMPKCCYDTRYAEMGAGMLYNEPVEVYYALPVAFTTDPAHRSKKGIR